MLSQVQSLREKNRKNYLFLDTEGQKILREVAVLNYQGKLIYEAFVEDHYNNENIRLKLKPLEIIISEINEIIQEKTIVCHNAEHDRKILINSFRQQELSFPSLEFICTVKLAQEYNPHYPSYSLSYLAKQLRLKVTEQFFRDNQAHAAYYDAQFTHQLFFYLIKQMTAKSHNYSDLKNYHNPFSSSRVDDPFQDHPDYKEIYKTEFNRLKAILAEIKTDSNYQSKGVLIIGEAGTGKTHLIMRIAKELLQRNRLLFIRQPNNADTVLSHTYARILESFFQPVPGRNRSQIELLIAHSFTNILSSIERVTNTQQGKKLISDLQNDSLSLFNRLGTEETIRHRKNWDIIERNILEWWTKKYSISDYSHTLLQGLIKFCRYSKPDYKTLVRRWLAGNELTVEEAEKIGLKNWNEDLSREEFALEAIKVFANLSTLDEPLIIVFDQLEGLGLIQNKNILSSFGSAIKEIITHIPNSLIILNLFPNRWQKFQQYFDEAVTDRLRQNIVSLNRPNEEQLKQILALKANLVELKLEEIFIDEELTDTLNQSSIRKVVNRASDYFNYKAYNIPLPDDNTDKIKVPLNLEDRVHNLENILQQIAQLINPLVNFNHQEIDLGEILDQSPTLIEEKGNKIEIKVKQNQTGKSKNKINLVKQKLFSYLDSKKQLINQEYEKPQIITDSDDIGKLTTIMESFTIADEKLEINQLRLSKRKIPEHLLISNDKTNTVIAFINLAGSIFTSRIKNFNELVISYPQFKFNLFRDIREPKITGKVGKLELEKLKYTKNGKFILMDQENRVNFELIYQLIIDIQEQDLEINLKEAIKFLPDYFTSYWLTDFL